MPTITVDGVSYEVPAGLNLLAACLSLGFDLPHFCWHPALHSVGACRQCAVKQFKDEQDTRGRIVMACMVAASDGVRISIEDPEVVAFRRTVIEWLMLNHPHDCPVCDEGGECHLQDMTVMTGHTYRQTRFPKRTHHNQDLGPFVRHEMNRCIQCYRCVRFYRDYAGGHDLGVFAAHDHVYFGRTESGALESEFAGNLVEVCPTGVFTDKTFANHYTRKWDLSSSPSVCVHCALGCNTIAGSRAGMLRRIRNRYHPQVNGYFLCDRGRYGYEFANDVRRLTAAVIDGEPAAAASATDEAARLLSSASGVLGIGSPRATLETLFALREFVGENNFCAGMAEEELTSLRVGLQALGCSGVSAASLADVRSADAVLILGGDPTDSAPMLSLGLRQSVRVAPMAVSRELKIPDWDDQAVREAVQTLKGPLYIVSVAPTRVDDIATERMVLAPADIARSGFAVAQELGAEQSVHVHAEARAFARRAAAALASAERPVVVADTLCGADVVAAAGAIARALSARKGQARLALIAAECDSLGSALMGGLSLEEVLERLRSGAADTLVVAENDLFRRLPKAAADEILSLPRGVIAMDVLRTPTVERAAVAFPATSFAEGTGTLVSNEGRAQRSFAAMPATGDSRESWKWIARLARDVGTTEGPAAWTDEDELLEALSSKKEFTGVSEAAPPAGFRVHHMKVPRQAHRRSGRTSLHAETDVKEHQPPPDPDSPLAYSMEGFQGRPPAALTPRYWTGGWNSMQALYRWQTVPGGGLRGGSPGVRLLENLEASDQCGQPDAPDGFEPRNEHSDRWLLVGVHHVFGSEELSSLAPGVASLAPSPYVALGYDEAASRGWAQGRMIAVSTPEGAATLELRIVAEAPPGVALVPVGLRDMPTGVRPGIWASIEAVGDTETAEEAVGR